MFGTYGAGHWYVFILAVEGSLARRKPKTQPKDVRKHQSARWFVFTALLVVFNGWAAVQS